MTMAMRETYKGRELKVLAHRNPARVRAFVNSHMHFDGYETPELAMHTMRCIIDQLDKTPIGTGSALTANYWYAPGTYDLDARGHAVEKGATVPCAYCRDSTVREAA